MSARRRRGRRKTRLAFAGKVLACVLLVELTLYLLYCGSLMARMPHMEGLEGLEVNCVDEDTLSLMGKTQPTYKSGSVCSFPPDKPHGVTRVGCFGDSFTYSFEVADGLDFPALLGRLFRDHDRHDVEVLNFGNDWTGFHQAWILFDRIGSRYGLDAAIFGPQSVYDDRDTTFCHAEEEVPAYIHARYVLDGDTPRLVAPYGGLGHVSRLLHHHALFPSWDQLRYDIHPPAFLQALLPPGIRTRIANPFYYLPAEERAHEVPRLYTKLLASGPPDTQLVVGLYDVTFVDWLERQLPQGKVVSSGLLEPRWFPYKSPGFHNSPTGNLFLATQYYNLLGLAVPLTPTLIETRTAAPSAGASGAFEPLHAFDSVAVEMDGAIVGGFVGLIPPFMSGDLSLEEEDAWQLGEIDLGAVPEGGAASLLALRPAGVSVLDAAFVPIGAPLSEGAVLQLACPDGAAAATKLGHVRMIGPQLGAVELPGHYQAFHASRDAWSYTGALPKGCSDPEGGRVLVDGEPVLEVELGRYSVDFVPVEGKLLILRAFGDTLLEPEPGQSGPVDLVLERAGTEAQRYPIASWSSRPLPPRDVEKLREH